MPSGAADGNLAYCDLAARCAMEAISFGAFPTMDAALTPQELPGEASISKPDC